MTENLDLPVQFGIQIDLTESSSDVVLAPKPTDQKKWSPHPKIVLKKDHFISALSKAYDKIQTQVNALKLQQELSKKFFERIPLPILSDNSDYTSDDQPPGFRTFLITNYREFSQRVPQSELKYPGPEGQKIPRFLAKALLDAWNPKVREKSYPEITERVKKGQIAGAYTDGSLYQQDLSRALKEIH